MTAKLDQTHVLALAQILDPLTNAFVLDKILGRFRGDADLRIHQRWVVVWNYGFIMYVAHLTFVLRGDGARTLRWENTRRCDSFSDSSHGLYPFAHI